MGLRRAATGAAIGLAAVLACASAAWACVPNFYTPPMTLAERFAEGAWLAEAEAMAFEKEPSGFRYGDEEGEPMRRLVVKTGRGLWGKPPPTLAIRQWDEEAPQIWVCMRYEPSFCPAAKPGDKLLILGGADREGGQESLECLAGAEAEEKAAAFRALAAGALARAADLRAAAAAAAPEAAYAAAMALGEALAEYGDHAATDEAFRAAAALDPARLEAWLRLARHRLEDSARFNPSAGDLRAGIAALEAYFARFGDHARLRRVRDDLALALGEALDLERADLRGAATTLPGAEGLLSLKGAPMGFDAMRSRIAFDAREADLEGARFREADLEGGDFSGAVLRRADMTDVKALGVSFQGADLRGADLSYARLSGADLSGADLRGATLTLADLRGADLSGADLTGAFAPGTQFFGARLGGALLDLRDAENPMVDFAGAFSNCATRKPEAVGRGLIPLERLCGEEERLADLEGLEILDDSPDSILVLERLDLRGANLSQAGRSIRISARIAGADLGGANFSESRVYLFWGAGPKGRARLSGADFRGAELVLNLPGADLREADFRGAHVAGLKRGYDLTGAKFAGATLDFSQPGYADPADLMALLESADLSGVRIDCRQSARPQERRLWAEAPVKIKAAGARATPACAEAMAASAP